MSGRFDAIAAATPESRDRYVDFLRAASILAVVLGHWMQAIITRADGRILIYGAVGVTSGLWLLTWVLQVMPVFFFVGGFSNYSGLRAVLDGKRTVASFLGNRVRRLLVPFSVFAIIWAGLMIVLRALGIGPDEWLRGFRLNNIPFGPLWFLAVYLAVTLASPWTARLHRRLGAAVPLALAATIVAVDLLAFGAGLAGVRWLNVAAMWLLTHQLGYFYADGSLVRVSRRMLWTVTLGALAAMVVLTSIGVYPRSMVGTDAVFFSLKPIERISNMNPPTVVILAHSTWLIAAVLLLRERLTRWLAQTVQWGVTVLINQSIMTVFLWHMTAYLVVILLAWPLGLGRELESTPRWWLERPFWIVVPAWVLLVLVAAFSRFERESTGAAGASRLANSG